MKAKVFAETERLILREITENDVQHIYDLDSDPLVHRYLGNKPIKSLDEARRIVNNVMDQQKQNGISRWAVIEKESGTFTGWSALKLEDKETNGIVNYIDLGFRFMPKYWGKGYATESGRAAVKYGFEVKDYDKICGAAHHQNHGSNKALQKCGLKFVNEFIYNGQKHLWYELSGPEYEAK